MDIRSYIEEATEFLYSVLKWGPVDVLGVDIGQSAVRIAEVVRTKSGECHLVKFGCKFLPEGALIEDELVQADQVLEAIQSCVSESSFRKKEVCIGLSGTNTMSKKMQIADGTDQEITDQVNWESEQYIPFGTEEAIVSYSIMGKNQGGGVDVMVAAAKKDLVESYKVLVSKSGLKLKIVDLDLFAVSNVFEIVLAEKHRTDEAGILLIDFGARKTNMIIYLKGMVVFTREINLGGTVITEEIQRQLGLSYTEAEDLKIHGDENGNIPEEIVEIIRINLDNFFNEIRKTLTFFMTASTDITLGSCYITGGTSLIPGLAEGLAKAIHVDVAYLNPFEKIRYNEKNFSDDDINYIASCGCVALGLALRKIKR
ncbi:MAG: type IV pilus assembly protein PilM [Oligoflexia bacterium]|nr:type IV pilus assembly protein PilM [Oligoflexia bacterium]